MKNKLIVVLAVIFGILAVLGNFKYMENIKNTYKVSGNFSRVIICKQKIPARTIVSSEMLDFKELPVEYVLPGTVLNTKDAVGKMALSDIYPGEFIMSNKLVGKDDITGGLSPKVEDGKRAISIPVNNVIALHGLINVGDFVDVLVTFSPPNEKGAITSTIVKDVPVLGINNNIHSDQQVKEELQTVTLMVEPEQAQQIALSIQQGSIQLTLRSPGDKNKVPVPSSRLDNLMR